MAVPRCSLRVMSGAESTLVLAEDPRPRRVSAGWKVSGDGIADDTFVTAVRGYQIDLSSRMMFTPTSVDVMPPGTVERLEGEFVSMSGNADGSNTLTMRVRPTRNPIAAVLGTTRCVCVVNGYRYEGSLIDAEFSRSDNYYLTTVLLTREDMLAAEQRRTAPQLPSREALQRMAEYARHATPSVRTPERTLRELREYRWEADSGSPFNINTTPQATPQNTGQAAAPPRKLRHIQPRRDRSKD